MTLNTGEELLLEVLYDPTISTFAISVDKQFSDTFLWSVPDLPEDSQMTEYEIRGSVTIDFYGFIPLSKFCAQNSWTSAIYYYTYLALITQILTLRCQWELRLTSRVQRAMPSVAIAMRPRWRR